MTFYIPTYVSECISVLKTAGYEAYCVGGAVRDMLLGNTEPSDFDIATNCLPDKVMRLFPHTVPTGISHGTVTVLIDKKPIEVTTYRIDGGYTDTRHPDSVEFVGSIEEDLSRRDFTVNAIAYDKDTGIVDLFCGLEDIKTRTLRTVRNPDERFCEDALRIMRLFRFASQLGFSIEENTLNSALTKLDLLENISAERIFSELKKMLMGKHIENSTAFFKNGALKSFSIPECDTTPIRKLPRDLIIRFCALLLISGKDAEEICRALKTDNDLRERSKRITQLYRLGTPKNSADIKRGLCICNKEDYMRFLEITAVLKSEDTIWAVNELHRILDSDEPFLVEHLKISGKHLIKMGFSGEEIGKALEFLQEEVIKNPTLNEREALIKLITKYDYRS